MLWIALVAVLVARPALADRPAVAVLPFNGPHAKKAEAVVVRTLRKKASLISQKKWKAAAKKLFAPSHSADDIVAVASDVGAKIVITGTVRRDGKSWQLSVAVRDGKSGHSRERLKYPLKRPQLDKKTLATLAEEIEGAIDHVLGAGETEGSGEDESAPKGKKPRERDKPKPEEPAPEARPSEPRVEAPPARPEARPAPRLQAEAEPEPEHKPEPPSAAVTRAPSSARPRWAPYFDLSAGASLSARTFDFVPSSLPHFSTGKPVPGVRGDFTLYPLAFSWDRLRGVFAGFGLGGTIEVPFWGPSTGPDGMTYATRELSAEGGLRWRFVLLKKLPRPELVLAVQGGLHRFAIDKREDPVSGAPVDVGPPDLAYVYLSPGLLFRLHFAEWARLWVGFHYQQVLDAGPIVRSSEYGPASGFAIVGSGGVDFFVFRGLKLSLSGHYDRYELSFQGSTPPPQKPGNGEVAVKAIDQYFGGSLSIGYEL